MWHVLFAKKLNKIRQIWPRGSLKHFTAAYRGFPPCTQSQPPANRETGYSNVLPSPPPLAQLMVIYNASPFPTPHYPHFKYLLPMNYRNNVCISPKKLLRMNCSNVQMHWYTEISQSLQGVSKKRYFLGFRLISVLEVGFNLFTCVSESEFPARFIKPLKQ